MLLSTLLLFLSLTNSFALTNSLPADSPALDNIVFIKSEAPDSHGDTTPGYCNATLLNSQVLITAAHCVALAYISNDTKLTIQLGAYRYHTKPDGTRIRVGYATNKTIIQDVQIELTTNLKNKLASRGEKYSIDPQDDVALVWWNNPLPETSALTYPELLSKVEYQAILKNFSATTFNVVSINPFAEVRTSNTRKIATLNDFKWTFSNYLQSKSFSRVEEGDSGAPIFAIAQGKIKLFGVVKGRASTIFDNWDVYPSANLQICQLSFNLPMEFKKNFCF
jgi:secreted trypsin-like serine protease